MVPSSSDGSLDLFDNEGSELGPPDDRRVQLLEDLVRGPAFERPSLPLPRVLVRRYSTTDNRFLARHQLHDLKIAVSQIAVSPEYRSHRRSHRTHTGRSCSGCGSEETGATYRSAMDPGSSSSPGLSSIFKTGLAPRWIRSSKRSGRA